MMKINRYLLRFTMLAGFALLGCLLVSACGQNAADIPAQTVPIQTRSLPQRTQIIAEGQVIPSMFVDLRFPNQGIISRILVEENETVQAGDIIAVIDGQDAIYAQVMQEKSRLIEAQQVLDDLFKGENITRELAIQEVAEARQVLQKAIDRRTSKEFSKPDDLILDGAIAQYYSSLEKYSQALAEYDKVDFLPLDNVARNQVFIQLTLASRDTYIKRDQLNRLLSRPNSLDVAAADAAIDAAQADLSRAEREYEKLLDGPDKDELAIAQSRYEAAEMRLAAAEKSLIDFELRTPINGTVVANDLVMGEFYRPSSSSPVIVADLLKWHVETTDLTEINVRFIQIGDVVTVRFDSLPDLEIGGKVIKVHPIGIERFGDITYPVTIQLDDYDEKLQWNMTAVVLFEVD